MLHNDHAISAEELRATLDYDPETGLFTWSRTRKWRTDLCGSVAGHFGKRYITIYLKQRSMAAHRLAWLHFYGIHAETDIDHIDRDRHNNRIANLRLANRSQNCCNVDLRRSNRSGIKGVSFKADCGKWIAQIQFAKKAQFLGYFTTKEDAAAAYNAAAARVHGEFAVLRGAQP